MTYRSILVVEDEANLRKVIARNLKARGCRIAEAGTVTEALTQVSRELPDLLLLDINLPDGSGWDVLRELRNRSTDVRTIVISAVRVSPNRLAEFRPIAYLPKPFPLEALLRLVTGSENAQNTSSEV